MTEPKKTPGFHAPPRRQPQTAEEFVAGAARSDRLPEPEPAEAAPPPAPKVKTLDDYDHGRRVQRWPIRLTDREVEVLSTVYNAGGFRSNHDYVLRAAQKQLEADYERITGQKVQLAPDTDTD